MVPHSNLIVNESHRVVNPLQKFAAQAAGTLLPLPPAHVSNPLFGAVCYDSTELVILLRIMSRADAFRLKLRLPPLLEAFRKTNELEEPRTCLVTGM